MKMPGRQLRWTALWWLATAFLVMAESQFHAHRFRSVTLASWVGHRVPAASERSGDVVTRRESAVVEIGDRFADRTSVLLILGCLGSDLDGEVEVTLRAERVAGTPNRRVCPPTARSFVENPGAYGPTFARNSIWPVPCEPSSAIRHADSSTSRKVTDQHDRVFFLHNMTGGLDDPSSYSAVACRPVVETDSIRIFVERTLAEDDRLARLIAAVGSLADRSVGPAVRALVGPVRDVDEDGKLAVVLTSQLAQLGGGHAAVDGLTRSGDFRPQVDRPFGNRSDVVFLNSQCEPGERLGAVLAHEWAHAAIFGRRFASHHSGVTSLEEDDWLNEALAHAIEVRASGSTSNVAHRVHQFLVHPEAAPLVVRDYYRPGFWRHDGCRGAAFLFLEWCLEQSGEELLGQLIDGRSAGLENLEAATGRPFNELFRAWTVSVGQNLARAGGVDARSSLGGERPLDRDVSPGAGVREWRLLGLDAQTQTVRLRGTTASFIRVAVEEPQAAGWRVSATSTSGCPLQLTVIPIDGRVPVSQP